MVASSVVLCATGFCCPDQKTAESFAQLLNETYDVTPVRYVHRDRVIVDVFKRASRLLYVTGDTQSWEGFTATLADAARFPAPSGNQVDSLLPYRIFGGYQLSFFEVSYPSLTIVYPTRIRPDLRMVV